MNIHDATDQAYKNGYEAGVKELYEKLRKITGAIYHCELEKVYKELTESKNDFKE